MVNKFLRVGKQDDKDPLSILQYLQKQYFPGDKLLKTGEELPDRKLWDQSASLNREYTFSKLN